MNPQEMDDGAYQDRGRFILEDPIGKVAFNSERSCRVIMKVAIKIGQLKTTFASIALPLAMEAAASSWRAMKCTFIAESCRSRSSDDSIGS